MNSVNPDQTAQNENVVSDQVLYYLTFIQHVWSTSTGPKIDILYNFQVLLDNWAHA